MALAVKILLTILCITVVSVVWGMWWDSVQKAEPTYMLDSLPLDSETLKRSWVVSQTGTEIEYMAKIRLEPGDCLKVTGSGTLVKIECCPK